MPPPSADFEGLLRAFVEADVRFVVIGGASAAMQGVPAVTYDLDLVLDPEPDNLDRAHELLSRLGAQFREHLPRVLEPKRGDLESDGTLILMTRLGPLVLLGRVATWGYGELLDRARSVQLDEDLRIQLLDLAALIEIKEAVGREKDLAILPLYRRALAEQEKRGRAE